MFTDKPEIGLLPTEPLYEIARVFQEVIKQGKYKKNDWRKGMGWVKNYNSLQRHLLNWSEGENKDSETKLLTLAHAGCRILMALEYQIKNVGTDDRYKSNQRS